MTGILNDVARAGRLQSFLPRNVQSSAGSGADATLVSTLRLPLH